MAAGDDGDGDNGKKLSVPKFSSFKPKPAPEGRGENPPAKKGERGGDDKKELSVPKFSSFKPKASSRDDSENLSAREQDRGRDKSRSDDRHRDSHRLERRHRDDSRSDNHRRENHRSERRHREVSRSGDRPGDDPHHDRRRRDSHRPERPKRHREDSRSEQSHRRHRSKRRRGTSSGRDESSEPESRRASRKDDEKPREGSRWLDRASDKGPVSGVPGLFVIDTKGDPLIRKYGLDRSKVPAFRRYGGGRVLGTDGRLVIHYDGPQETFSLVFPGERGRSLAKDGLRSTGWQSRNPVRMRAPKHDAAEEEPGDYISLEGPRKSKRQSESEDSSDDEQPVWRSIKGKATSGQIIKSDPEGDEGESSAEDFDDTEGDNPLKWKSILLNRRVKEHPEDIGSWMELVDHQDDLMHAGGITDGRTADDTAHSFSEIKLSMLESALPYATDPKDRERVLHALMHEGSKIWTSKTAAKRWHDISEEELESFALWKTHLNFAMSDISSVEYDTVKQMLLDRLHRVVARSGLYTPHDILQAIYVFLRVTRFIHDSGYQELAIAAWQALLELNLLRPNQRLGQAEALEAFEEFWESEVPRLGEAQSLGWKHFVEFGGEPPAPAKAKQSIDPELSMDTYMWGVLERLQERQARMPARTLDDGTDDDPFRIVMFSDLRPLLFQIPATFLPTVYEELIDSFLLFCGLPPAFDSSLWTTMAQGDQFLAAAGANIEQKPAWEAKEGEEGQKMQRKHPRFASGLSRAKVSPGLLFGGPSWFQHLDHARHQGDFDMSWVQNTLKQLAHSGTAPRLALYYLGVCFAREPETIRKPAKALLKKYPCEAELYDAYALAEYANDDEDVAIKVLSSATSSKHLAPASTVCSLLRTWSWIELDNGNKCSATKRLCACVDESFKRARLNDEQVSPTVILKAKQMFKCQAEACLYEGSAEQASVHLECLILLSYLTDVGGSEPASESQGNIAAAMFTLQDLSKEVVALEGGLATHELMLQFAARLLYWHASKGPFRRVFLREQLSSFIERFPRNTIFLLLFEWTDVNFRVINETRNVLDDKVLVKGTDCVSSRIFSIQYEMAQGNAHSTKAAFERALKSDVCKSSVALWIGYVRFVYSQKQWLRQPARDVLYRGLKNCPWSKNLLMEAFGTLVRDMKPDELLSVYREMTSKGMRVHVDMEDYMAKTAERRA